MSSLAPLLAGAIFSVSAPSYGVQNFDVCPMPAAGSSSGTVESVRVIPATRDLHAFDADALEHKVAPEMAEQLVVRLDAGPVVIFTESRSHGVRTGERVRVTLGEGTTRVERQPEQCSTSIG
jgi:hypothetical protein